MSPRPTDGSKSGQAVGDACAADFKICKGHYAFLSWGAYCERCHDDLGFKKDIDDYKERPTTTTDKPTFAQETVSHDLTVGLVVKKTRLGMGESQARELTGNTPMQLKLNGINVPTGAGSREVLYPLADSSDSRQKYKNIAAFAVGALLVAGEPLDRKSGEGVA